MIVKDGKKIIPFYEDYKPVEVRRNNVRIAGWLTETKSGEAVDFVNTYNDKAEVLVSGNSMQDGEPRPENPVPVLSAGECNLVSRGKNMLDTRLLMDPAKYTIPAWYNGAYKAIAIPFPNGTYMFSTFWPAGFKEEFEAGTTLMVLTVTTYIDASSGAPGIYAHTTQASANKNIIRALNVTDGFIYFAGYNPELTAETLQWFYDNVKVQIEPGSVATPYEPFRGYQESALPTLRKIGDVTDTYNPVTGEYVQRIGVKVFDGTENFFMNIFLTNTTQFSITLTDKLPNTHMICSHFQFTSIADFRDIEHITESSTTSIIFFHILKTRLPAQSVSEFKAYLAAQYAAGTPVTVYYQLAEPVVTYLDPATVPTYPWYTRIEQDGAVKGTIEARVRVME